MTVEPAQQRLLADLTAMLLDVTGEDERWGAKVTPASRLEADLRLDSLEVTALSGLLSAAYGARVDLAGYLAGLEIDEIIALTVGDLLGYVGCRLPAGPAPGGEHAAQAAGTAVASARSGG